MLGSRLITSLAFCKEATVANNVFEGGSTSRSRLLKARVPLLMAGSPGMFYFNITIRNPAEVFNSYFIIIIINALQCNIQLQLYMCRWV